MQVIRDHTHYIPRADGTYRVYVERRQATRKYRLKLRPEEAEAACQAAVDGDPLEAIATRYQIPQKTLYSIIYERLLERARRAAQ